MTESAGGPQGDEHRAHPKWTAERLLLAIEREGSHTMKELARLTATTERSLELCRDGVRLLEPEVQMRLAAVVVELAPNHRRLAYRLYGQAQSALRTSVGDVEAHSYYPNSQFR